MYALFDICGIVTVGLRSVFRFERKLVLLFVIVLVVVVVLVVELFSWYCCCGTAYADILKVKIPCILYNIDIIRIAATNVNDDMAILFIFVKLCFSTL